jgi:hypothetical protein
MERSLTRLLLKAQLKENIGFAYFTLPLRRAKAAQRILPGDIFMGGAPSDPI